jgi:hypothetical protein
MKTHFTERITMSNQGYFLGLATGLFLGRLWSIEDTQVLEQKVELPIEVKHLESNQDDRKSMYRYNPRIYAIQQHFECRNC